MRLDPTMTHIALGGLAGITAFCATKWKFLRTWFLVLCVLSLLDLAANLLGFGPFFWWSPLHLPSTAWFGVDEILEHHGALKTTLGYVLDLVLWSAVIAVGIALWKRKKKTPDSLPSPTQPG